MALFITQIINGLNTGSIYALVALGYTMVYGIVKLINFAHGEVIMVGSYVVYLLSKFLGIPFIPAVIIAMVACAGLGVTMELIAYKPLRNSTRMSALITAIGVSLFLQNAFMARFKSDPRPFPSARVDFSFNFSGMTISGLTIITIIASIVLMLLLQLLIKNTRMGKAMRAVSEDSGAATLMGINVNRTITITFAIGSALAAVGGAFYSSAYPLVDPYMGASLGLKAFVAAVLGGIGLIPGAMVGGFLIGIVESLTKGYISSQLSDAVVFSILIIVLLLKPAGLLGKSVREKV